MAHVPDSDVIEVDQAGHVATVWLDRRDSLNAMGPQFWTEFPSIIEALGEEPEVRVIVVAARGKAFTAGIDLKAFAPMLAANTEDVASRRALYRQVNEMQHTFTSLAECPKPVIAAVHGYCIGGGMGLITACDIRLATEDAVFSVRESTLAMVADVGTLQRLPKIVDAGRVAELVYTGKDFPASEAFEMGLVSHLYPDAETLHKEAIAMAHTIASNSPLAVQGSKHILRVGESLSTVEALDYMALWNSSFLKSRDLREAMMAKLEGRDPQFEGT